MRKYFGETLCENFDVEAAEVFCNQFTLSRDKDSGLESFAQIELGDWILSHGPEVPVCHATASSNRVHVAMLGIAVDPEGVVLNQDTLAQQLRRHRSYDAITHYLSYCAGRYAFIVTSAGKQRIYGDPGNTLGFVYDATTQMVASSLHLCIQRQVKLNTEYPFAQEAGWNFGPRFAFGHTPDTDVRRPLGNHYLDLKTFETHRFWPTKDIDFEIGEDDIAGQDRALDVFIDRHTQVLKALSAEFTPTLLPLSAGRETRILLACSLPFLDQVDELYSHEMNGPSRVDVEIGRLLAKAAGRDMRVISADDPDVQYKDKREKKKTMMMNRIALGFLTRAKLDNAKRFSVTRVLPKKGLVLRGYTTDLLKAVLWERGILDYENGLPHNNTHGLKMMFLFGNNRKTGREQFGPYWNNDWFQNAYADWRNTLPENTQRRVYDFSFMEHFQAHGHGTLFYHHRNNFYLGPGNDRKIIEAATSLPPALRRSLHFHRKLHKKLAPQFLDIPYAEGVTDMEPAEMARRGINLKREKVSG